jgi:hypothetical protein
MSAVEQVIVMPSGERVKVSASQAEVVDALMALHRKGMADATRREVIEMLEQQLGRVIREHVYSGRFSELVKLAVLEEVDKRDDRFTLAIRAQLGRASRVLAYRIAQPVQRRLPLRLAPVRQCQVIGGRLAMVGGCG